MDEVVLDLGYGREFGYVSVYRSMLSKGRKHRIHERVDVHERARLDVSVKMLHIDAAGPHSSLVRISVRLFFCSVTILSVQVMRDADCRSDFAYSPIQYVLAQCCLFAETTMTEYRVSATFV